MKRAMMNFSTLENGYHGEFHLAIKKQNRDR